jgi:hypothetical protein
MERTPHHTIDGERVHGQVEDGDDGGADDAHLQVCPPLGHHRGDLPAPVDGGYPLGYGSRLELREAQPRPLGFLQFSP